MNAPKLTGIDDWYLERQLLNYRNGIRGSHADDALGLQMQSMAKTLKDEQAVKDIVAYIQSLQEMAL
jgi:cytochrome c oxidase subunit 2